MSKEARELVRRHAPTAAVNARHAGLATVVNVHGARYLVDGDGRGKWDAKLVRKAPPMAVRRSCGRGAWMRVREAVRVVAGFLVGLLGYQRREVV